MEIDAVLRRYGNPISDESVCGFRVMKYTVGDNEIIVLNCGIGEIAAAAGTQVLVSVYHADIIVNFGVVGGLCPEMKLAKTCIVKSVVHYDFNLLQSGMTDSECKYRGFDSIYIPTDEGLLTLANSLYPDLKQVVCASADKFVGDPNKKRELHTKYNAHICEMEAAGILLTAIRNGIPCLLIKTVSDSVEGGKEEFVAQCEASADVCMNIVDAILNNI